MWKGHVEVFIVPTSLLCEVLFWQLPQYAANMRLFQSLFPSKTKKPSDFKNNGVHNKAVYKLYSADKVTSTNSIDDSSRKKPVLGCYA